MTFGPNRENARRLIVVDASYTFEMIKERSLERSVTCRDLEGFFEHVWTVHPFASLLTSSGWTRRHGRAVTHEMTQHHSFVEGKVGLSDRLAWVFPLNFFLGQMRLFFDLVALGRRERVTAVRAGDPLYVGLFGWALSRALRVPLVIRVNGNNDKVRETTGQPILPRLLKSIRLEKLVERFVLSRAAWVFAPNRDNADFAIVNGAMPETTSIVHLGSLLDERHFDAANARADASEDLRALGVRSGEFLLCIGRLEPPKFPDHVALALERVRSEGFDLKAVFIGDGSMREQLTQMSPHTVLAGNRDQAWLARMIPHCAAVLSPSTGRALSEAALAGVPIIAYDTDWQSDLIRTGETGILVGFRDWEAMAKGTADIMFDRNLARKYGDAVRELALEMLDPKNAILEEARIYRTIEHGPGRLNGQGY